MRHLLIVFLVCLGQLAQAQSYTVESVPNVKVDSNNYVSNPDGILSAETVNAMDQQLRELEARTTAQVAVVVLNSIGEQDIFNFAQELFTKWGIGQSQKDNGLLVLLVMDQHTVRFHTGHGLEGILPDVICKRIQEQDMVPLFKEGKYDEGMRAGMDHVVRIISDPRYAQEIMDTSLREESGWAVLFPGLLVGGGMFLLIAFLVNRRKFADSKKPVTSPYQGMRLTMAGWITEFVVLPVIILLAFQYSAMVSPVWEALGALYLYFMLTLVHRRARMSKVVDGLLEKKKFKRIVDFFEEYRGGWLGWAILYPIPFLPHYFNYKKKIQFYRDYPRDCQQCGKPLRKLDEAADDAYLTKAQVMEEELKSMDYDIWLCDGCGMNLQLVYPNKSSKYEGCPKCKTRAYYLKSDKTLVSATTSSSGKGEKTHECKFCGHKVVSTYTIARIAESSSSSGGGSSSSGGSFGGGSSGGGGASSSW